MSEQFHWLTIRSQFNLMFIRNISKGNKIPVIYGEPLLNWFV